MNEKGRLGSVGWEGGESDLTTGFSNDMKERCFSTGGGCFVSGIDFGAGNGDGVVVSLLSSWTMLSFTDLSISGAGPLGAGARCGFIGAPTTRLGSFECSGVAVGT